MKLAIVGSRKFNNYEFVCEKIHEEINVSEVKQVISGGADGVDSLAKRFAEDNDIDFKSFLPDYKLYKDRPKYAPLARNKKIANECDVMIAFYYEDSNGTKNAMKHADGFNKKLIRIEL